MTRLTTPRYQTANATLPGNKLVWDTLLNQSDLFAYNTANDGKGGPFGAQLWLVNEDQNKYILVGTAQEAEDSNAVVSKGRASAHAEAENLSPQKRGELINFLKDHSLENWKIVQVSSGESCPSCRTKQVLLADELIEAGFLGEKDFHVVFKATYDQTKRDADFNDAPYDQTFRAISELGVLNSTDKLLGLENTLKENDITSSQIQSGELVYNAVDLVESTDIPEQVNNLFKQAGEQPVAIIVRPNGDIMSIGLDERDPSIDGINAPEKTAIVSALYKAAAKQRDEEGKFEAWNLEGARLYTNISDIGPMAYSEALWYNLSDMKIVEDYTSTLVDALNQELPGTENAVIFEQVAADYNTGSSPLQVIFNGDPEEASVAHLLWKAKMAMEGLKNRQTERLSELTQQNNGMPTFQYIDGTTAPLSDLILSSQESSHYDGKQAELIPTQS
ncbi:MAG: hypothetical protein JKY11_02195 [Alphaproteobacteria bacterium]|nr:hypothetical protein [Alphaproteobacteria bacterium]